VGTVRFTSGVIRALLRARTTLRPLPARCWPTSFLVGVVTLVACARARDAHAELGPCMTAAPTTPDVVLFVTDIDKSVHWYQNYVGVAKISESNIAERQQLGTRAIVMARNRVSVTLISSAQAVQRFGDPQIVCFPLDGPPAPSTGSKPIFLIDPDRTSVELPPWDSCTAGSSWRSDRPLTCDRW
jgi:hypothetical protein